MIRRVALWGGGLGIAGACAAFVFAWSGLFNVGASTGHWAVTDWFLHFVMRSSVSARASAITVPSDLADPALVRIGAGHYATGCAPCHGAPDQPRVPPFVGMVPPPPGLADITEKWEPAALFWIVQHGVKMTGMPPWPTQARDDEVWAMVAFLQALPELDAESYRDLAYGNLAASGAASGPDLTPLIAGCARCHGADGRGAVPGVFPDLSVQSEAYLADSLTAYAAGLRASGIMQAAASPLSRDAIGRLATHFAGGGGTAPPATPAAPARRPRFPPADDAAMLEAGERLARHGAPDRLVPACIACHGPDAAPRNPNYPTLSGQPERYIATQLRLWRDEQRGGGAYAPLMRRAAAKLEDDDIAALAAWYAAQPLPRPAGARP